MTATRSATPPDSRRKWALIVVLLAAFMDLLDSTIVNVAIPSIQSDIGASFAQVQWIIAAYLLSFAVLLVTGGRLGDIFGRRRLFLIGVTSFTLASALCGLASNPELLIAARGLQGLAAALMVPQVLSIVTATFPPAERGAALGAFGGLAGLATVGGPILGAVLTDLDLFGWQWRTIFLINVPVGILTLVAAFVVVRESRSERPLRLDLVGVVLLAAGMLLLLVPLVEGRERGWPAWTFISMALAVVVLLVLVRQQRARSARDGSPLIAMNLFRLRSFSAGLSANLIFFTLVTGYFLIFTLYLQAGLGYSVLKAGLTGIPWSFGTSFAAAISATVLTKRLGRKVLVIGAVLLAAGFAGIGLTTELAGTDVTPWQLLPALLVGGIGMGMIVAPILDFILAEVPTDDAGSGSGLVNAVQQVGGAIGIAVIGVIFFSSLSHAAGPQVTAVAPELRAQLQQEGVPAETQDRIIAGVRQCFEDRIDNYGGPEPQSCRQSDAASPAAATAIGSAANEARGETFTVALRWSLGAIIALVLVTLLLITRLPREAHNHEEALLAEADDDAATGAIATR
ncbi:MFS transporter [Paractinoplanes ferrugineus]|uniref:MFS transporter n=1 Tax=Paractinoplanes ferrugineus TaxID=113564 RepID=A0A919MMX0_9ACTN|nr:MFS transporter [Actinoplanes ferrugineus]GIE13697.1 MFS transporter [Actinoplanes ferrugineus]